MEQKLSTKEEYVKRINVIVEYINNHLGENIDLGILSEMSGFSPWHFHRIVRAFLGEPIGAFITRMRVETAARLLRYSELPVQDIAFRVGYDVPSSLSKSFRLFYGISPNQYRKNKNYTIMKPIELRPDLPLEIEEKVLALQQVIYVRLAGAYVNLDYSAAWQRLWNHVREENLFAPEVGHLCIYHDDPKVTEPDKLRTDVCLALPRVGKPKGEVGVKEVAGGKYAIFRYRGPYLNLHAVYDTIYLKWIPERGYKLGNTPGFEKYLNHPDHVKPEDLVTEVYIPVE
mgnify:CR=1 FL=1